MNENEEYFKLLERLKVESPNDVIIILNTLNEMERDQLRALFHFLFPEESKPPDEDINRLIESLKEKGKQRFRVKRNGNDVIIEIL